MHQITWLVFIAFALTACGSSKKHAGKEQAGKEQAGKPHAGDEHAGEEHAGKGVEKDTSSAMENTATKAHIAPRTSASNPGVDGLADRTFAFTYEASLTVADGQGPVDIFVPLAQSNRQQEVLSREVEATIPGDERSESRYENRFWHGHRDMADGKPIRVAVHYVVRRKAFRGLEARSSVTKEPAGEHRQSLARFLLPNRRVPVSGPLIDAIRKDLRPSGGSRVERARAIYDYVIDNMEYKKVGRGWGNGDTFWACTEKYGNCTDFHALFISLARAEGIPARFKIGFPIPEDRSEGVVAGYHCWVEFYLAGRGWLPIDASEAWKNPARRDLYFGTQPADRIQFTVGRDLELGNGHQAGPLNYFIYPHVEVAGRRVTGAKTRFYFRELNDQEPTTTASKTGGGARP